MALKITNCFDGDRKAAKEELKISQHISSLKSTHEGSNYVRVVEHSFEIETTHGRHLVLAFQPLREPLWLVARHLNMLNLASRIFKPFLRIILKGLDFLHSECKVIHTGKTRS